MKIIGMGFVSHKNSYMREGWNILDFLVVWVSFVEFFPNVPSLKSLRVLRVLRPLRSINAIPSMRILLSTLFLSIPQLGSVVIFLSFIFLLFGILGINQYTGVTYNSWRTSYRPFNSTYWPKTDPIKVWGKDGDWNAGEYWGNPETWDISLEDDGVYENKLINYGVTNFDNLFEAMITIFQVITTEGWSDIMYMIDDTSANIITPLYFVLIVIIGSFFLLNLILAVIMRVFTQNDEIEKEKNKKLKILDETQQIIRNTKNYLYPLKVDKIERSKSSKFLRKFSKLDDEQGSPTFKKAPAILKDKNETDFLKPQPVKKQNDEEDVPHSPFVRMNKTFREKTDMNNDLEIEKKNSEDDNESVKQPNRKKISFKLSLSDAFKERTTSHK